MFVVRCVLCVVRWVVLRFVVRCYELPVARCAMSAARCSSCVLTDACSLCVARRLLFVVCDALFVVCCCLLFASLFAGSLFGVCCLLLVV